MNRFLISGIAMLLSVFCFNSCGDDDEDKTETSSSLVKRVTSVDNYYSSWVHYDDAELAEVYEDWYLTFNSMGYVSKAVLKTAETEIKKFEYDENGYLIKEENYEGETLIETFIYSYEIGNLTRISCISSRSSNDNYSYIYTYLITPNTSGFSFYRIFGRSNDMCPLAYAGLLGKASADLPYQGFNEDGVNTDDDFHLSYTFNDNGYPVSIEEDFYKREESYKIKYSIEY